MTEEQPQAEQAALVENHQINAALLYYITPIDAPLVHPRNARIGDVAGIRESLERFGQVRPILVQESSAYIVAGNHTFKAAKELGWTHIAAVGVKLPDEEALSYMIADNRLADRGSYDDEVLAASLQQLMLAGKLAGTGYSPDEVDDLLSAMDALPEGDPEEFEGDHAVTDEELAHTFRNRSLAGPLRQFVVLYPQDVGEQVEGMLTRLARAWGVSGARDVILEALRRANQDPPIEHLTPAEKALADAPPTPEPVAEVPPPEPVSPDSPGVRVPEGPDAA